MSRVSKQSTAIGILASATATLAAMTAGGLVTTLDKTRHASFTAAAAAKSFLSPH
jgi:hypothetical protein